MRFTIDRNEFLKGLNAASKAITGKSIFPVLNNIRLSLEEKGLNILGSDGNLVIKVLIPFKRNDKEIIRNYEFGDVLLNLSIVEWCRRVNSEELILETFEEGTLVNLSSSDENYSTNSPCIRPEEYLNIDLEPSDIQVSINKKDFVDMILQVGFAASAKQQRIMLSAINFKAHNGVLTVTATDAARFAEKKLPIPTDINFSTNILAKTMNDIVTLIDTQEYITLAVDDKKVLFMFEDNLISTNVIPGDYMNTSNIPFIDKKYILEVTAKEFINVLNLANLMSEKDSVVLLNMNVDEVTVSSRSSQLGSSENKILTFKYDGEPFRIAFNSSFVIAAIKALNTETVLLEFQDVKNRFIVRNPLDDSIIQVVTPHNLRY